MAGSGRSGVERAGGQFAFESTDAVGSVLRIKLPAMGEDE
jgi:hypothetical protein